MEEPARRILPPERLTAAHDVSGFSTGKHPTLDEWLRNRALASEGLSARAYVIGESSAPLRVAGYYAISTAMEERVALPNARLRRGMPEQVPLLLIGRLALHASVQRRGVGTALLADALRRCLAASEIVGARAVVAQAIDDDALTFYRRNGFLSSPLGERVVVMPIETVRMLVAPDRAG